jgi:hypothetical protein
MRGNAFNNSVQARLVVSGGARQSAYRFLTYVKAGILGRKFDESRYRPKDEKLIDISNVYMKS